MDIVSSMRFQNASTNTGSYDEVKVRMPKGQKDIIKAHADKHDGGSVNAFINRAITNQMERDNTPDTTPTE